MLPNDMVDEHYNIYTSYHHPFHLCMMLEKYVFSPTTILCDFDKEKIHPTYYWQTLQTLATQFKNNLT